MIFEYNESAKAKNGELFAALARLLSSLSFSRKGKSIIARISLEFEAKNPTRKKNSLSLPVEFRLINKMNNISIRMDFRRMNPIINNCKICRQVSDE